MPRSGTELRWLAGRTPDDLRWEAMRARLHAFRLADGEAAARLRAYADELDDRAKAMDEDPSSESETPA
jgi:hypothetical protein